MDAKKILAQWKEEKGLKTYKELADSLGVALPTIDTWKNRNEIPKKYFIKWENMILCDTKETYIFDIIDLHLSAGYGIEHFDVDKIGSIEIGKKIFKTPLNPNNIMACYVYGDSMETTLHNGDLVLIDTKIQTLADAIYVISLDNEVKIKRLQFVRNKVKIISDNERYETITIDANDENFKIIGKKILTITQH